ncbi:unnamed protein product [Prorocentrum cordatum]|uniref:Apple domain-containing protein n=1 Tax=Prorocentrum cordatum TaxID=2364126 RepID=A0ABN9WJI8_9DINO|nr:unnamed protein product [Polarella glacialis]|mmetsp:Transcript_84151/g.219826  ORF Transcript_84151/g.219826 Transcript_84151/m.219826 type:complete len:245 (+) Transcript_84151:74-808(+)
MAIKTVVRAAVTVSVVGAISVDMQKAGTMWTMSDLPRSVLKSKDDAVSGCGKEIPGYFQFPGLKWANTWRSIETWNSTVCAQTCDDNSNCIAFTAKARQDRHGKMHCNLYKGLLKQMDHRAMSYMRCVSGFDCEDGFQFTHAGTWKGGKQIDKLDYESKAECRLACYYNRGCVGFTYRVTKEGDTSCFHFENEENKEGPTRDMRSNTYSKCAQFQVPAAPESQALDSKDEESLDPASADESDAA